MTSTRTGALAAVALAIAVSFSLARLASAQGGQHDHDQHAQTQAATPPAAKPDMMADMKKADAELKALVGAMNTAKGDAKVEAMAKVINALVARHESMQARMADMRASGGMMGGRGMTGGGAAKPDPKAPDQK